jgi:hypothetical protein
MSEHGVFAVHRGVFNHPFFAREPFTEREAWMWLIAAAAWKATQVRVGRNIIALKRSQLAFSTRFLRINLVGRKVELCGSSSD